MIHWVHPKNFNPNNYSDNSSMVCFIETDLDYPDELHDFHKESSLAPEKMKVTKEILSKYHRE